VNESLKITWFTVVKLPRVLIRATDALTSVTLWKFRMKVEMMLGVSAVDKNHYNLHYSTPNRLAESAYEVRVTFVADLLEIVVG
jgi:hypothetical protein